MRDVSGRHVSLVGHDREKILEAGATLVKGRKGRDVAGEWELPWSLLGPVT